MAIIAHPRGLTAHPAFRWLVALWFAALLGLGLWVMPPALHEAALARTGLTLPAPLTAQLAISLAGALIGLLLGLLIAARTAPRQPEADEDGGWDDEAGSATPEESAAEPSRRRLFNPHESVAEGAIAAPFAPPVEVQVEETPPPEPVESQGWTAAADIQHEPPAPIEVDALADLTLPQLTERLSRALGAQTANAQEQMVDDLPPPIPSQPPAVATDAALRSALERLSRVQNR